MNINNFSMTKNAFFQIMAALISSSLNFILLATVSNFTENKEFGIFSYIWNNILISGAIIGSSCCITIIKIISENSNNRYRSVEISKVFGSIIILSLIVLLIQSFITSLKWSNSYIYIIFGLFSGIALNLDNAFKSVFIGNLDFKSYFLSTAFGSIVFFIINISLIIYLSKTDFLPISIIVAALAQLFVTLIIYIKFGYKSNFFLKYRYFLIFYIGKNWRNSSVPMLLASLLYPVAMQIINSQFSLSDEKIIEIGVFSVLMQWLNLILFVPNYLGKALLPSICGLYARNENDKVAKYIYVYLYINVIFVGITSLFVLTNIETIINFYGANFAQYHHVFINLFIVAFFMSIAAPVGLLFNAGNGLWSGFFVNVLWFFAFLISFLLHSDGSVGSIVNTLIVSYGIHSFVAWTYYYTIFMRRAHW